MMILPVIMSGGSGSRLWPLSRALHPKQFLALLSEKSLLQETINRLDNQCADPIIICNNEHRFIVASIAILFIMSGQTNYLSCPLILVTATLPYLIFNLGLFNRWLKSENKTKKNFMGDAGSMFVGLSVIWLLTLGIQGEQVSFNPVTALWICAIPIMDMAAIIIRRYKNGKSPFKPDRDHLHHILPRVGFTAHQTLIIISSAAAIMSAIGLAGEYFNIPEVIMLVGFLVMFAGYVLTLRVISKQ